MKSRNTKLTEGVLDGDDEDGFMARSQLYFLAKNAISLHGIIQDRDDLPSWVMAKLNSAAESIEAIQQHIEYAKISGGMGASAAAMDPEDDIIDLPPQQEAFGGDPADDFIDDISVEDPEDEEFWATKLSTHSSVNEETKFDDKRKAKQTAVKTSNPDKALKTTAKSMFGSLKKAAAAQANAYNKDVKPGIKK